MSSLVLSAPPFVSATADSVGYTGLYQVSLAFNPIALGKMSSVYLELLLGSGGSPGSAARLTNFVFSGGGIIDPWFNRGASGDFKNGITMQCRPQSVPPQVLGVVNPETAQMSFNLWLNTKATKPDWFTLWLHASDGTGFPTTAAGRPGLFGSVSWSTDGSFTAAGYTGNGQVNGVGDAGFSCQVTS